MKRLLCALLAVGLAAHAETVELLDGTKMTAKLVHYYDGVFTFEVAGQTTKVPQEKIRSIVFELPQPRAEFGTPKKTFDQWQAAFKARDFKRMIECYALMYQGMAAKQFESLTAEQKAEMWKQAATLDLKWESVEIKGEQAAAKIQAKGEKAKFGGLNFVRENGEWKMTPIPFGGSE